MNPFSQQMQAQGRGNDSVLVHMTPREVGGLQALAQSYGGTLTRNPTTGLPEAGFLDSILPMLAGAVGGALNIDPYLVAAGAGLAQGAITGNLEKGLTAGLSAYGGASLGRTLNPEGTIGGFGFNTPAAPAAPATLATTPLPPSDIAGATPSPDPIYQSANSASGVAPTIPLTPPTPPAPQGMFDKFGTAASAGITNPTLQNLAPYAAGLGLAMPFLGSSSSGLGAIKPTEPKKLPPPRMYNRRPTYPVNRDPRDSSEFMFFPPEVPYYPAYADGGDVQAKPRNAPTVALPPGYTAQAPARSYVEQLYNFPRATNVPKLVKPTAKNAALQTQYPTATKAQLSEYERAIEGGGDPRATRSLMQAYGPTSGITTLQPGSPDYKGDRYRDSRPVDAFGNPIGWTPTAEEQASADNAMGRARMSMEGITEPDSDFLAGFRGMVSPMFGDYGDPSWGTNVQTLPGAPPMLKDPMFNRATGYTGSGSDGQNYANTYGTYQANKNVESQRQAAMAQNAADNTAENYALYGGPDAPEDTGRYISPVPSSPPASSGSSTFLGALNSIIPSLSGSSAAPRAAPRAAPSGPGLSDLYSGNRTLGSFTGFSSQPDPNAPEVGLGLGQVLNAATGYAGLPGTFIDFLRNTYGGGLASAPGTNTLGIVGNTATSPGIGAQLGAKFNRLLGGTNKNAAGGVNLEDGSFVVDARTVAELGNGSSGAGQEVLARLGGRPIHGPGDGVSDSIRANIGGTQEARVARDEVKFSPEAVKRLGRGNPKKGADRLYDMMKKAEKARKSASRGKDTGLRALAGAR
jgi:hypothetical protein